MFYSIEELNKNLFFLVTNLYYCCEITFRKMTRLREFSIVEGIFSALKSSIKVLYIIQYFLV